MILREVTIGRSKDCDIYLDPRCEFASSYHAAIYMDGTQLMYKDCSRNGTLINNVSVHNRAVPIKYGDVIMLTKEEMKALDIEEPKIQGSEVLESSED